MAWPPQTEAELQQAAENGLLREGHDRDLKWELPRAGPGGNVELATDMASMAIDGGLLFYGVDETAQPPTLVPFDIRGAKERIDQVSKATIDEPLHVRVLEIHSSKGTNEGYVVVLVPPSSSRPHMVRGRYRGRGDTTNRVLSDAEVVRLHQERQRWERQTEELLDDFILQDPTRDQGTAGHLFVVAQPVAASDELVLHAIGSGSWQSWMHSKILQGPAAARFDTNWGPDFASLGRLSRRASGWAAHSAQIGSDGLLQAPFSENTLIQLEVSEGGRLRLFCGRGTDVLDGETVLVDAVVTGLVKRIVLAANVVSVECGYLGSWDFGVALTRLRGSISFDRNRRLEDAPVYSEDEFKETTRGTHEEVFQASDAVVLRLVGRLRRAFGDEDLPIPRQT
jgi:hypothetical protein